VFVASLANKDLCKLKRVGLCNSFVSVSLYTNFRYQNESLSELQKIVRGSTSVQMQICSHWHHNQSGSLNSHHCILVTHHDADADALRFARFWEQKIGLQLPLLDQPNCWSLEDVLTAESSRAQPFLCAKLTEATPIRTTTPTADHTKTEFCAPNARICGIASMR